MIAAAFFSIQKALLALPSSVKRLVAFTFDIWAAWVTVWLAILFSAEFWHGTPGSQRYLYLLAPGIMIPVFYMTGIYRAVSRYCGFTSFLIVVRASVMYGVVFLLSLWMLDLPDVPHSVGILQPMMFLLMIGGSRAMLRFWLVEPRLLKKSSTTPNRLLIYGAGKAGTEIARALQQSDRFDIAGYFDDDHELQGRTINGLPVFNPMLAESIIKAMSIRTVLVAMPSANRPRRNEIVRLFQNYPVSIKTLPGIEEIADGQVSVSDIKQVEIEDLLGREPVPVDHLLVGNALDGKVIMVTGAGGSIGSELCRQIFFAHPSKLLLVDNSEFNLYNIHSELETYLSKKEATTEVLPLLCDVTDEHRFNEICRAHKPAVIYHAAAYKHVPMVEHNPAEGVRNNVFGTLNIVEAALANEVSSVVLISTDKAVRPTNVMGASKRLCEMIFQAVAAEKIDSTCFSMVRFGNVLGSSGSVVPLFRRQIENGGPLTITHEDITRFFMTIPEAAQLVIQAGAMAEGGDVFLLDMGSPVKIMDLACRMIELSGLSVRDADNPDGDIEIIVTGLRPGEKLYEELLIGDNPIPTANPRIFKANEHFSSLQEIRSGLLSLSQAISGNDVKRIRRLLKNMVQEYQPSEVIQDIMREDKSLNYNISLRKKIRPGQIKKTGVFTI